MNNFLLLVAILFLAFIGYLLIKSPLFRFVGAIILLIVGLSLKDSFNNEKSKTIGPSFIHDNTNTVTNSSNDNSNPLTTSSSSNIKCTICGSTFTGDGYCEDINGKWISCKYPHSSLICSEACGIKSTQQFNKAANDLINSQNSNRCTNCGLGHYVNGFCDQCGAASKERVRQSHEKKPDCPICKGTGIEKPMGANSSGESGRICSMCGGAGKQSY